MARTILSVGFEVPGGEVEQVDLFSRRSLLDADVVIFSPAVPYTYESDTYLGKTCLSDDSSFRAREALTHWRRELSAAIDAGKLVVVILEAPAEVYAATGEKRYSGTGRNARETRIVDKLRAYDAIPVKCNFHAASGTEMNVVPEARYFTAYWSEFGPYSEYEVYLEGELLTELVKTKAGNRVVGACVRKGRGAALLIPALDVDQDKFVEYRSEEGKEQAYWTQGAINFGRKFASALVRLADAIASEMAGTPPPSWTQDDAYRLPEEAVLEREIGALTAQVMQIDETRRELETQLETEGRLRALLYEQGKPLERVIIEVLHLFGFDAKPFKEDGSEFDAVFTSPEGRFIGEAEGKDNRPINIDKFSQLERNLNEDFAREGVDKFAKGVLFGNAFRLRPPAERESPFTEKCGTAAERLDVALVNTPDLFAPARYLKTSHDADYAKSCRRAILETSGDIVKFPDPPIGAATPQAAASVETVPRG